MFLARALRNLRNNSIHTPLCLSYRDTSNDIKLILKGQIWTVTSGQGHDLTQKGYVAYQLICLVNTNTMKVVSRLTLPYQKSLSKTAHDLWWRHLTPGACIEVACYLFTGTDNTILMHNDTGVNGESFDTIDTFDTCMYKKCGKCAFTKIGKRSPGLATS